MTAGRKPELADLNALRRFTAWQSDLGPRGERTKPSKTPYQAWGTGASSRDPDTWLTLAEAVDLAGRLPRPFRQGGIGIFLGALDGEWTGWSLGGVDYDACVGAGGLAPWAAAGINAVGSYSEMSPSGSGVKQFFLYRREDEAALRTAFGIANGKHARKWSGGDASAGHPPAIEVYLALRFFAITGDSGGMPPSLEVLEPEAARRLAAEAAPMLPPMTRREKGAGGAGGRPADMSRSAEAFRLALRSKAEGLDEAAALARMAAHPYVGGWIAEKCPAGTESREWRRVWDRTGPEPKDVFPLAGAVADASGNAPARPVIQVRAGRLSETADAAEQALLAGGTAVYSRDRTLVAPSWREVRTRNGGAATVAGLHRLTPAAMLDLLSQAATWCKRSKDRLTPCDPPQEIAAVLLARAAPRPFPEVSGISATPGLRPDGSISTAAGYDPDLNIHRVADRHLRMPEGWNDRPPVKADAEAGLRLLDGLLKGFPFVEDCDRAVALALILTCLCRPAVPTAPVFAVTATAAGTGKSHLVDLASAIATGQRCPATGAGQRDEETEKRLGGLIAAGYPLISIDNLNGTLRSDTLSQATERDRLRIRLLGSSDMPEVECRSVFVVNGNGLTLTGDLIRRTFPCRLDAGVERPENRPFAFDPVGLAEAGRGPYVAAGLAMLRAHAEAGFPGAKGLRPLGSYEDWSRHVRGTLTWLGVADPIAAMDRARLDDPDTALLRDMLTAWMRRFGTGAAHTTAQAVELATGMAFAMPAGGDSDAAVRGELLDVLQRVAGDRGRIDQRRLGAWIGRHAGRVQSGLRFAKAQPETGHSGAKWRVERVKADLRVV